jgi:hypothetical protein
VLLGSPAFIKAAFLRRLAFPFALRFDFLHGQNNSLETQELKWTKLVPAAKYNPLYPPI